jgi:beta-lactam-binding protein with PASTA domain
MRRALVVVAAALLLVGCASQQLPQPGSMPDVVGLKSRDAFHKLDLVHAQMNHMVYRDSDTDAGNNWVVCKQRPDPGKVAVDVVLALAKKSCDK